MNAEFTTYRNGALGCLVCRSTVTVALRISNMGNVTIQPGVIDIPKVNVDAIVKAVNDWMRTWMGKGEEKPVKEDDDSEDDIDPDLI